MGKNTNQKSVKPYRNMIQGFFLILIVSLLVKFFPSHEFLYLAFVLILLTVILLNTGFCGWICPIGTFVDLIRGLGKKIGSFSFFKPANKKFKKWVKNNKVILDKIDKYAKLIKYIFLLWILQAIFLGFASISDGNLIVTLIYIILYVALLVSSFFVNRAWCRYACPLGAVIGLFGRLSPTKVTRDEEICISCNMCTKSCPMNIDVASKLYVRDLGCSTCLKCVDVCPVEGALDLKMKTFFSDKKASQIIESVEEQAVK